ncbi:MAG: hypothetical protein LBH66_04880 [Oscillospiraceae bacterium]|jgi:hypothetical protein|nr:hypothetical protein [Oscillospiraceae bacterium]
MIAVRIKSRSEMGGSSPVRIRDVAYVISDVRIDAGSLTLPMPRDTGIWLVDAGSILSTIYKRYPSETVRVTGESIGWLRRLPEHTLGAHSREWLRRTCAAMFGLIRAREDHSAPAGNTALAPRGESNPEAST